MDFQCCSESGVEAEAITKTHTFLRVIADPNRLKILCVLKSGSKCVCEIFPLVGISNKLVSHHLKQLKSIGIVSEKREGNFIRYKLDKKMIREYKKIFNQVIK